MTRKISRRTTRRGGFGVLAAAALFAIAAAAVPLNRFASAPTSAAALPAGAAFATDVGAAARGAATPQLTLVRQSVAVAPESAFEAEVVIDNLPAGALAPPPPVAPPQPSPDAPAGSPAPVDERALELFVTVHEQVRTRSGFKRTLEGSLGDPVFSLPPQVLRGQGTTASRTLQIPVTAGPTASLATPTLRLTRAGVYPVKIALRRQTLEPVAELVTYLIRSPGPSDSSDPLLVGNVITVSAPPSTNVDGTTVTPAAPRLAALLTAISTGPVAQVPVDLDLNPETMGALFRLADPAADQVDVAGSDIERERLAGALQSFVAALGAREIVPRPVVRIDPGAWERAGFGGEVDAMITTGIERLEFLLGPDQLSNTWVADEDVSAHALAAIERNGARQVVIPEDRLEVIDRSLTLTRPFVVEASSGTIRGTGDGPVDVNLPALMADASLAAHFPDGDDDPVLHAHRLLADLSVLYFDQPGEPRAAVVTPPPGWEGSADFLRRYLSGLAQHPFLRPSQLDELFEVVSPAAGLETDTLVRRVLDTSLTGIGSLPAEILAAREQLVGFTSMLLENDTRAARLGELLVVAASSDLEAAEQRAYIDRVRSTIAGELAGIETPRAQNVTLTGDAGSVVVAFRNRNAEPLAVRVCLENSRLDFPEGNCRSTVLQQRGSDETFRVRARAAGTFRTDVVVTSPDGRIRITEGQLTIRSSALSGVGVVLTVGAGAFLVGWWGLHWRRGRRDRRLINA